MLDSYKRTLIKKNVYKLDLTMKILLTKRMLTSKYIERYNVMN